MMFFFIVILDDFRFFVDVEVLFVFLVLLDDVFFLDLFEGVFVDWFDFFDLVVFFFFDDLLLFGLKIFGMLFFLEYFIRIRMI